MYQRFGTSAFKKDLTNIIALCDALGNPHRSLKCVHVAGTNGKGSVSHMLASIFQTAGYKTGLYTSPHLIDFRERIRVNGVCVSEEFVIRFVKEIEPHLQTIKPSFFEITVAMAFQYFSKQEIEIAIIETGLGGRLDSTNIIHPELSIITNIGYDHMDMLGETLAEIAFEKAGIIKPNTPVVIGERHNETTEVFTKKANECEADIMFAEDTLGESLYASDLKGYYQKANIKTVIASCHALKQLGYDLTENAIQRGLLNVARNTGLMGRWQLIQHNPRVICDTGHNTEGIQQIVKQLTNESFQKLHIVFGQVVGKDYKNILSLLPKNATYYFTKPSVIRGLDEKELLEQAVQFNLNGQSYSTVEKAYHTAKNAANKNDLIYVGGSTFVVADFLASLG